MEINSFGTVMKFALDGEAAILETLDRAKNAAGPADQAALIDEVSRACRKNLKQVERSRRENVNEMILEPISGLDPADYRLPDLDPAGAAGLTGYLAGALEALTRYYADAAEKLVNEDARRVFLRLAKKNSKLLEKIM